MTIVLAAPKEIVITARVSSFVQLLLIIGRLDADFENNRKLEISQLFLTCTGNGLTWIHPVVDQDSHLNDEDDKTSNV